MLRMDLGIDKPSFHLAAPFGSINECVIEYAKQNPYITSLRGTYRGLVKKTDDRWNMKANNVDKQYDL